MADLSDLSNGFLRNNPKRIEDPQYVHPAPNSYQTGDEWVTTTFRDLYADSGDIGTPKTRRGRVHNTSNHHI